MTRKAISTVTVKKLFALSWNICAFEWCNNNLCRDWIIVAEMGHIEGYSPEWPRYNPNLPDKEKDSFDNLILLCRNCHSVVDKKESEYSVQYLKDLKIAHEEKYKWNRYEVPEGALNDFIESKFSEILDKALQNRDQNKVSKEFDTISAFFVHLSDNEPENFENITESEPDPQWKIYNRFQNYSSYLLNELASLIPIYDWLRKEVEKTLWFWHKEYKKMTRKLRRDSIAALEKSNNNPIIALSEMKADFEEKLGYKNIKTSEAAIRYCLLYRMVECFIFPNE